MSMDEEFRVSALKESTSEKHLGLSQFLYHDKLIQPEATDGWEQVFVHGRAEVKSADSSKVVRRKIRPEYFED